MAVIAYCVSSPGMAQPPYFSGTVQPNTPISARPLIISSGIPFSFSSISRERGATFFSQYSRTDRLNISCSLDNLNSIFISCYFYFFQNELNAYMLLHFPDNLPVNHL